MFLLMAGAVQAFLVYYYAYPMWAALGLRGALTDSLMLSVHRSGTLASPLASRLVCLFFTTVSVVVRSGNSKPSGSFCHIYFYMSSRDFVQSFINTPYFFPFTGIVINITKSFQSRNIMRIVDKLLFIFLYYRRLTLSLDVCICFSTFLIFFSTC